MTHKPTPARLWVGPTEQLTHTTEEFLQQQFCANNGCGTCAPCQQIRQRQFYGVLWLTTQKQYVLDDIAIIHETLMYQLEPGEQKFIIIESADLLGTACANSLLKSLEEPPAGYQFVLLAQRSDAILPTIRSRCVQRSWYDDNQVHTTHPVVNHFLQMHKSPATFLTDLQKCAPSEHETRAFVDDLFAHWLKKYKAALTAHNTQERATAARHLRVLKTALNTLPMPGSSKLFWKNLYLSLIA